MKKEEFVEVIEKFENGKIYYREINGIPQELLPDEPDEKTITQYKVFYTPKQLKERFGDYKLKCYK